MDAWDVKARTSAVGAGGSSWRATCSVFHAISVAARNSVRHQSCPPFGPHHQAVGFGVIERSRLAGRMRRCRDKGNGVMTGRVTIAAKVKRCMRSRRRREGDGGAAVRERLLFFRMRLTLAGRPKTAHDCCSGWALAARSEQISRDVLKKAASTSCTSKEEARGGRGVHAWMAMVRPMRTAILL